jgi:DNA repair protein RadD
MLLRPRQKVFVERSISALNEIGNVLSVAPTGAGKTVMFSEIIGRLLTSASTRAIVLAHRDELTEQNRAQFQKLNPSISTSVYDAKNKSWDGRVTFAMVPTLSREENLATMPATDLLIIDEAHHAVAKTYQRIIDRARELNDRCRIFGVTATPNRSDGVGLKRVFTNVADQISVGELVGSGNLVTPRTFVMDVGVNHSLASVGQHGGEYDMEAVEEILNTELINSEVINHWEENARDRQTVVFCSTIAHAEAVAREFTQAGISTVLITGELGVRERKDRLREYASGSAQVVVNVAVLTEGWDHPPTSCVVLLRPSSAKSTMVQMIGRGLRTVDARLYPGIVKTDCVILDFGTSSLTHGTLEQDIELDDIPKDGEALQIDCPSCGASIPLSSSECPICGHTFDRTGREKRGVSSVQMMEINLLNRSHFQWADLFGDDASFISGGFDAWGGVFYGYGTWHSIGGRKGSEVRLLTTGSRIVCLSSADDWLNEHETDETAFKTRQWLNEPPTTKQIARLPLDSRLDFNLTRYRASARITFEANKNKIASLTRPN